MVRGHRSLDPSSEKDTQTENEVLCAKAELPETVTEIDLGVSFTVHENCHSTGQAYATPVQRRRRVEVSEKNVSGEWNAWLDHDAVEACCRERIPRERIIRSPWVLTVKADGTHKAQLCPIGFFDPDFTKVHRDAPTLSAVAEHLLLQLCASKQWRTESLDVRTTSFAGDDMDRNMYKDVPADLRKELHSSHSLIIVSTIFPAPTGRTFMVCLGFTWTIWSVAVTLHVLKLSSNCARFFSLRLRGRRELHVSMTVNKVILKSQLMTDLRLRFLPVKTETLQRVMCQDAARCVRPGDLSQSGTVLMLASKEIVTGAIAGVSFRMVISTNQPCFSQQLGR